jgi:hypothetical protein
MDSNNDDVEMKDQSVVIAPPEAMRNNASNSAVIDKENAPYHCSTTQPSNQLISKPYHSIVNKSLFDEDDDDEEDCEAMQEITPSGTYYNTPSHAWKENYGLDTGSTSSSLFSPASSTLATVTNYQNRRTSNGVNRKSLVADPGGSNTLAWEDFVKKGTRIKMFLDGTFNRIGQTAGRGLVSTKRSRNEDDNVEEENIPILSRHEAMETQYAANLAREKTAQVMQLQRVSFMFFSTSMQRRHV